MSGGPGEQRPGGVASTPDEGFLSTVDAGTVPSEAHARSAVARSVEVGESITPDAFLAEVGRIPPRADLPLPDGMPRPGDTLGRFTILSELGRGGMGVVYAAEDRTLGRQVALKVLPTAGDEERRQRFLREARSAAALTHAGIATLYDVGEVEGRVFIAMELVRGRTLRDMIDARVGSPHRRGIELPEALRIACDITRALARAHARGFVHRDLKPENVMIADDGAVKLLDFGLAKQSEAAQTDLTMGVRPPGVSSGSTPADAAPVPAILTTEDGRILGTPSYMSPEQAKGRRVDARSDVFSFGVMLYELCTGARPFTGATPVELFIALDRDEPALPSQVNPAVPPAVERVILRCLRKAPAERYPDAGAVLRDLERAHEGDGRSVSARPWKQMLAAALAAVVLVVTGAHYGIPRLRALSAPAAMPVDETPMPSSSSEAALAAYRGGLEALRKGKGPSHGFVRAIELDPTLGAAHVQLAAGGLTGMTDIAREHLRKAEDLRGRLGERDLAILNAVEPVVGRQPSDWAETNRRLTALTERFPGDAQIWFMLGVGHGNYDDFDIAVRDIERALAIDPGYAAASMYLALMLEYSGHSDKAHKAVERCLERDPSSIECLGFRARLESEAGSCEAMEGTSRQLIAATSTPLYGYKMLAHALAARGRPVPTVREAVRLANEIPVDLPAPLARERKEESIASAWSFAAFQGDFEAAEQRAREYAQAVAGSRLQQLHGAAALDLANVLEEVGRSAEAAKVAGDFLDQRDAWEPDPRAEDGALGYDTTPMLLRIALHGGRLSAAEVTTRRDTWLASWQARLTPVSRNFLWLYGFARVVETPEDARAALDVLPTYGPLPPYRPWTLVDADVGRTYLLAGRVSEALDWIERATHKCLVLHYPIDHIRSYLLLGQAREAAGDKPGACVSYQMVLDRWGQAKPRSVTAERARARIQALDCKR